MRWARAALASLTLAACGGAFPRAVGPRELSVAEEITDESYPEALRVFEELDLDEPARTSLRNRIVRYLDGRTADVLRDGDYEAAVQHFARMASLFSPDDFGHARLAPELLPIARFIAEQGSPRGDEGRVLSALLVLHALDEDRGDFAARYEEVADWSRRARATVPSVVERFGRLIDVWEVHSELTPAPEVLQFLTRLHIERRNYLARALDGGVLPGSIDFQERQSADLLLRRAPLDIAAVYLQHGDIASAVTMVRTMGSLSPPENQFVEILAEAAIGDERSTDAILELADAYRRARPQVAQGLCRVGHRRAPDEPRYPLCLARVAVLGHDFLSATVWYAAAIRLSPSTREFYDEALEQIRAQLDVAQGGSTSDMGLLRGIAHEGERILDLRTERWPEAPGAVSAAELHLIMGVLEKQTGNLNEAERRFKASLEARQSLQALLELGSLVERTGDAQEAAQLYRRALDAVPAAASEDAQRAEILEHIGDAYRRQDMAAQATRMYEQALAIWEQLEQTQHTAEPAYRRLRRGIVLSRLGRFDLAKNDFLAAIEARPDYDPTYVSILSHLVVAQPDYAFATDVFRRAQRELTLAPEWRVYLALWLGVIATRAGVDLPEDVQQILHELSGSEEWWGRLAGFGSGELPYADLLAAASGPGEQTEAHFYQATKLLAHHDATAARSMFELVLRMRMVSFYEFAMAQELLQTVGP